MGPCHAREDGTVEHVHSAGRAALLTLEPSSEAAGVEDVFTRKLLTTRGHLFATDGAEVGLLELFICGVWTPVGQRKEGGGDKSLLGPPTCSIRT